MEKPSNLPIDLREVAAEETTIREALQRGVAELLPNARTLEQQMRDQRIKLYLGIDPTSPDLHIGHTVPLRKLRHFQDLGHEVVLLFGTFTGMIGDPTDKSAGRVRLTPEQVAHNVATYAQQAGKILDLSPDSANPITIAYNHDWLGKMNFAEVVDLMSNVSAQQMLERSMFKGRVAEGRPVWLHELVYPLMQGWDAVALGVDLEVGGRDQTFNMLVGRDLVRKYQDREMWVMALKLIEDPDGKKMGKTEGNIVNVESLPEIKYESIMTWPDAAIPLGFELLTTIPLDQTFIVDEILQDKSINPYEFKRALAFRVVADIDGVEAAKLAESEYEWVYRQKELPHRLSTVAVSPNTNLSRALLESGLVRDEIEAQLKLKEGAVYVNLQPQRSDSVITDSELVLQLGRRTIKNARRIIIESKE